PFEVTGNLQLQLASNGQPARAGPVAQPEGWTPTVSLERLTYVRLSSLTALRHPSVSAVGQPIVRASVRGLATRRGWQQPIAVRLESLTYFQRPRPAAVGPST